MNITEMLENESREIGRGGSLTDYAAQAAFDKLVSNWNDAINDGINPVSLLSDIDEVCDRLNQTKEYLKGKMK